MVTIYNEMFILSIWFYGIAQVLSIEPSSYPCVCGSNIQELCHLAARHCATGRDFPESSTISYDDMPSDYDYPDAQYLFVGGSYKLTAMLQFDYKCLFDDDLECRGKFQVSSPIKISVAGLTYTYLCDDVLRCVMGENSYGEGIYLSTFIRRLIVYHYLSLPNVSLEVPILTWISCPRMRYQISRILSSDDVFQYSQLVLYSCWCFGNFYSECHNFLGMRDSHYLSCYRRADFACYQKLCSDDRGRFIDFLKDVEGFPPFGSDIQTY